MYALNLESFLGFWFLTFGAMVGSFLNVVIFRNPRGFYVNLPSRSMCVKCNRQLSWKENIPIFSYLFLRGRCLGCKTSISYRYPFVEFFTAVLFYSIYNHFGFNYLTLFYCIFSAGLICVIFIDLDFKIIPDEISIGGTLFALLVSHWIEGLGFYSSLQGVLLGGGLFWFMGWAYEKITKREGLGFGDVKLLAFIGAVLGPKGVIVTIVFSSFIGTFFGLIIMLIQRKNLKYAIPYGPFLAIGTWIQMFWGDTIEIYFKSYH